MAAAAMTRAPTETPTPMLTLATLLRPLGGTVEVAVITVIAVEMAGRSAVVGEAAPAVLLDGKIERVVDVDPEDADVEEVLPTLETPSVAARNTPSLCAQQVVFPFWQHQVPSPQSVSATFSDGFPFD
jgi:hypothetical protein